MAFIPVFGIPIYPYGMFLVPLYSIILAYVILKHRLMDIEVVIKKGIVYATLSAAMAALYFVAIYVSEAVFRRLTGYSSLWVAIPLVMLFSLLIQPLRFRIQELVDKLFFKARYDYQRILSRYSAALRRPTTDLDKFLKISPYLVKKSMKLSGAGVLILDRSKNRYEMRAGEGIHKDLIKTTISDNYEIVNELKRTGQALIKEEQHDDKIKSEIGSLKASLLIPAISKSEYFKDPVLIAVFVFGPKLSDDAFSASDIDFLETIARQASIIIEYAFILEELRRDEKKIVDTEKFAALGTMAGSVVKALQGPIEDMEKYSQTMSKKFDDQSFRDGFVKDVPKDITRLDRVVNDLLVYARPMKLNKVAVKLNDLIRKAVDLLRVKETKEHVSVEENFSEIPDISADPQQLLNALMRLTAFAVASAKGKITVSTYPHNSHVLLSVNIPDMVIPREVREKIFSAYYSPKVDEGGLELATAAKIIEEHGGSISVESEKEIGTKILASLPISA